MRTEAFSSGNRGETTITPVARCVVSMTMRARCGPRLPAVVASPSGNREPPPDQLRQSAAPRLLELQPGCNAVEGPAERSTTKADLAEEGRQQEEEAASEQAKGSVVRGSDTARGR